MIPLLLVLAPNTHQITRTRWPILAVINVLKRLYFGVLVHIKILGNELELTELSPLPPHGTQVVPATKNLPKHMNLNIAIEVK